MLLVKPVGSAPPAWSPSDLANLLPWYPRDTGITARTAAQFTIANSEQLTSADAAWNTPTAEDFWVGCWVYMDAGTTTDQFLIAKSNGTSALSKDWELALNSGERFELSTSDGATETTATATTFGALPTATWAYVMGYYDHSAATLYISVNAGTEDTKTSANAPGDGGYNFSIGGEGDGGGRFFGGRMQGACFGKVADITAVKADIIAFFYNSGNGRLPSEASSAQRTAWGIDGTEGDAWDLTENSGNRASINGVSGNALTDVNSVTNQDGKVAYTAEDGDLVNQWADASGNGYHMVFAWGQRPTFDTTAASDGGSGVVFSAAASTVGAIAGTSSPFGSGAYEIAAWFESTDVSGFHIVGGFSQNGTNYQAMFHDGGFNNAVQSLFTIPTTKVARFFNYNGADTQKAYNGTTEADSDASTDSADTGGQFCMGSYRTSSPGNILNGPIMEMFAVGTAVLTTDERASATTYLESLPS